ncbi:MAG: transporter substrate-binding domain-containing protein [Pseudomonadota bacterium]
MTLALPAPGGGQALAQTTGDGATAKPRRVAIKFRTGTNFPPFNYVDEDGVLVGFNIDIARAICLDLNVACDIKTLPWAKLLPALPRGEADAVIASHRTNALSLRYADFTKPYYFTPARFVALRSSPERAMTPVGLEGRSIAVVKGTAHEAYALKFFRDSRVQAFASDRAARQMLLDKRVDYLFGDGIALMFWLNGTASKSCCTFRGGAFHDAAYFGGGIAIAVTKRDRTLRVDINRALARMRKSGRFEELFLRYFPLKVY